MKGKRGPRPSSSRSGKKGKKLDPKKDFNEPVRKPRQGRLPGTEDPAIAELEGLAEQHSETLTQIRASREELKGIQTLLATAMRKLGRTSYNHGGIVLKLREGKDTVSVKVKRHDAETKPEEADEAEPSEDLRE